MSFARGRAPLLALLLSACSASAQGSADLAVNPLVAARPYTSVVPAGYSASRPTPLVLLLHGYSASGLLEDAYFGLSEIVDKRGFLYAYPDGTVDQAGQHFWNATDACCNFFGSTVDDVAYRLAVVDDMRNHYNVDGKRIFVAGHSNGGFMAHRLGCDASNRFAAIMALAGDVWNDPTQCQPTTPISVLQVHGDADQVILYGGGQTAPGKVYPAAPTSVKTWAGKNRCTTGPTAGAALTLDRLLPAGQTVPAVDGGCASGVDVELWTIHGGTHIPNFVASWADTLYDWLAAHPKP